MPHCYLNGQIIPVSEAKVGVYDIGLLRGFGVYEALVARQGKIFRFADHMERFRISTDKLNIQVPASDAKISAAIYELIQRNNHPDAIIKFILTGGEAIGGIEYNPATPTFYILVEAFVPLSEKYFTDGCSLMLFEFQRQFPELKTTNYIQAVLLQQKRKDAGALEILYTSQGKVLECATSNFFIVTEGKIITSRANILEGITRKVVLELARQHFPVEERDVSLEELYAANEAFLASSFKDVVGVVKVGGKPIADGRVGPITKNMMRLFHEYALA